MGKLLLSLLVVGSMNTALAEDVYILDYQAGITETSSSGAVGKKSRKGEVSTEVAFHVVVANACRELNAKDLAVVVKKKKFHQTVEVAVKPDLIYRPLAGAEGCKSQEDQELLISTKDIDASLPINLKNRLLIQFSSGTAPIEKY